MSHPVGAPLRDRMDVEFVEADVEIGFNLVDMAAQELDSGNQTLASRLLEDAEGVFQDIGQRLEKTGAGSRASFGPLVAELRKSIDVARQRQLHA